MSQAALERHKLPLHPKHQDLCGWRLETLWKMQGERERGATCLDPKPPAPRASPGSTGEQVLTRGLDAAASREGSSILPAGTNAKSGLHLTEPDKSNNHRLVGKLLAFQQRLINSDSIKSLLINYAERYYCRLEHGIIIGLTTVYKNEM